MFSQSLSKTSHVTSLNGKRKRASFLEKLLIGGVLISVMGRADGSPMFILVDVWCGGQGCFMPRTPKIQSSQIKSRQHSSGGGRQIETCKTTMPPTDLLSRARHRLDHRHPLVATPHRADEGCHPGTHQPRDQPEKEPPQCASMWWSYGREREAEQLEHYKERWNCRLEGGDSRVERPVVSDQTHHLLPW